jgi:hypothetical protein
MSARSRSQLLDRYTEIGALTEKVRKMIKRTIVFLSVVVALEAVNLFISDRPGAGAFALIGLGSCIALRVWCSDAIGLPLLPVIVVQSLIIYGVPIVVGHEMIQSYPPDFVMRAGTEVLVFEIAMVLAWKAGMQLFHPSPAISYALQEFNRTGVAGWTRLGFGMITSATLFQVLEGLNLTDSLVAALPSGASSILDALVAVMSASGFFLVSMTIGGNEASATAKVAFWGLLVVNGMISASEFLLYSAAANLITVAIGFFWSNGRVPWKYLTIAMLTLSFLNTGKSTMREKYWGPDYSPDAPATFARLPALYVEWIGVSYDAILENEVGRSSSPTEAKTQANKNQTLLDRIDNLQNLLFVIDAEEVGHIKPLHGATYSLIPPLLVPRILWPNKPRSHEGQVLLNVHFGRQDESSTFSTYIAWGLLPEAYGNFGPIAGSTIIGISIGLLFAWIENLTARKLVVSMEGFLSLTLLMNLLNSFEMVASVLVTSSFQSLMIIVAASAPFVHRTVIKNNPVDES